MTESRAKELGLVPLDICVATHLPLLMSGRTCCSAGLVNAAGAGTRWIDDGRSDMIDMHEAFAAQTLANIQLLGANVLRATYWGVHMPLAKWTMQI